MIRVIYEDCGGCGNLVPDYLYDMHIKSNCKAFYIKDRQNVGKLGNPLVLETRDHQFKSDHSDQN